MVINKDDLVEELKKCKNPLQQIAWLTMVVFELVDALNKTDDKEEKTDVNVQ